MAAGPINSWDRQPYVTTFGIEGPGVPTAHMVPRNISYNFLVANYGGGNGAVDNDDESLRYDNNHNFQVCNALFHLSVSPQLSLTAGCPPLVRLFAGVWASKVQDWRDSLVWQRHCLYVAPRLPPSCGRPVAAKLTPSISLLLTQMPRNLVASG